MLPELHLDNGMDEKDEDSDSVALELQDQDGELGAEKTDVEPEIKEADFTLSSVQQYLRDIGAISLLNRQREIELAMAIETGQAQILRALSSTPLAAQYVIGLGQSIAAGELELKEVLEKTEGDEDAGHHAIDARPFHRPAQTVAPVSESMACHEG